MLVEAPGLRSRSGGKSNDAAIDLEFEERLEAVRRCMAQILSVEEMHIRKQFYARLCKSLQISI